MVKWLFEKVIGWPWCSHKWAILSEKGLDLYRDGGAKPCSTGKRFYLQCGRCGDLKKRDLA